MTDKTSSTDLPTNADTTKAIGESSANPQANAFGSSLEYERLLDCIHCGLCTSSCPTYLETANENDSPRGRIHLMRSVVEGKTELSPRVEHHLELCLDCRACETACPSGVEYGRLIEPFRIEMENRPGRQHSWFEKYILHALFPYRHRLSWALLPARLMQKTGIDRLLAASGLLRLLPNKLHRMHQLLPQLPRRSKILPEFLPASGTRRATVGLFLGCVADAVYRDVHWATARVLQQNGCDVVIPQSQQCCGAIHYHSGAGEEAMSLARDNVKAFADESIDAVIVNVAGCGAMMKDLGQIAGELGLEQGRESFGQFASKCKDVVEFLDELGVVPPKGAINRRAVYHDACHLAHAQQIRMQPRTLLQLIPGLEVVTPNESEVCCGAAGSYNLTQPDMADRLGARKISNLMATQPELIVTGNVGCRMQLEMQLRERGESRPIYHPVELLDASYRGETLPVV